MSYWSDNYKLLGPTANILGVPVLRDFLLCVPVISAKFCKQIIAYKCRYVFKKDITKLKCCHTLANGFLDCISANAFGLSTRTVYQPCKHGQSIILVLQMDYKRKPESQNLVLLPADSAHICRYVFIGIKLLMEIDSRCM